jgi:hypothetical protein
MNESSTPAANQITSEARWDRLLASRLQLAVPAALSILAVVAIWWIESQTQKSLHQERLSLDELQSALKDLKTASAQQTAVLHRALGKQIPIQLPENLEDQLASLSRSVNEPSQWPKGMEKTEELRQRLSRLVTEIPPWAEQDLLPRLVAIRWAVEVLWTIQNYEHLSGDKAEDAEAAYHSLLEKVPDGAPKELHNLLEQQIAVARDATEKYRYASAMEQGRTALRGSGDLTAAWNLLDRFDKDTDASALRRDLRLKILDKATRDRLTVLRATLERSRTLRSARLQQAGLSRVYDAAIGLLLDLEVETPYPEAVVREVTALVQECEQDQKRTIDRQQEDLANSAREYQKWALGQIREFDQWWYYDYSLEWATRELKSFKSPEEDKPEQSAGWDRSLKDLMQKKLNIELPGAVLTLEQQREVYSKGN